MGQAAGEVVLLEAMEAAAHASPQPVGAGNPSQPGASGVAKPERLLEDEPELIRPARPRASPCGLRFAPSMAARRRRGHSLVRFALNNRWLEEQGVPDMKAIWIALYYGPKARV